MTDDPKKFGFVDRAVDLAVSKATSGRWCDECTRLILELRGLAVDARDDSILTDESRLWAGSVVARIDDVLATARACVVNCSDHGKA